MKKRILLCASIAAMGVMAVSMASAEIAVSVNDNHMTLKNGAMVATDKIAPDTLSLIDLSQTPPKILENIEVPASVTGPPTSVVIAPDESFAIVTSATRRSPEDASKLVPDNSVSVVDLTSKPPKIVQQTTAGQGASGVAISPDEKTVLVANRSEGTISVFSFNDKHLEAKGKVDFGNPKAGPSSILFVGPADALVSRDTDNMISQLHIDGDQVAIVPRPMTSAVRPYTLVKPASGRYAAISNLGRSDGDVDSVSLIDTMAKPMRVILTVSVPGTPEGIRFSPDGAFLAVGTQNGTNKPDASPFHSDHGLLVVFAVGADGELRKVAEAPTGHWSQGVAFSHDGHTILVQNMIEKKISVFHFEAGALTPQPPIAIDAGPAGLATAW